MGTARVVAAEDGKAPTPAAHLFVLVGGWPGSGKTTLASALAGEMKLPLLGKDKIKEALADVLGRPAEVAESQRLGRAAVQVMLRIAQTCPGAVMDSTWFPEVRPLVMSLPGEVVEVRCIVPKEVARSRYSRRAAARHEGHLDLLRTEEELWGSPSLPLGVGPVIQIDTAGAVDIAQLTREVLRSASRADELPGQG